MDGPAPTAYHRWVGWHAPALRRLAVAGVIGVATGLLVALVVRWELAVLLGWDAAALAFLGSVWPVIVGCDAARTELLVSREDVTRSTARLLLLAAAAASLVSVVYALHVAGDAEGTAQGVLIAVSAVTVAVSWTVLNTVFTLRYAEDFYRGPPTGIDFGGAPADDRPDYRDFAYVAFTVGVTYQVSDTNLRNRRIRRTVLLHAFLAYLYGVVIVAAGVNIVASLLA